ncbi:MAG: hypothetical protein HPY75_09780 [Actinobacteria bacterium]|nr:hypothetical protein [Actinomycetota bacterium]
MTGDAALPQDLMGALRESYTKFKRRQLVASFFLLAVGAAMLTGGLTASPGDGSEKGLDAVTFLRYCGATFILLWLLSVFLITRNASLRRKAVESMERDPSSLVWFFLEDIAMFGTGAVKLALRPHFNLADGTHAWFQVDKKTARKILEYLAENRADISLGYGTELRKRFRKDPRSLASAPTRSEEMLRRRLTFLYRNY